LEPLLTHPDLEYDVIVKHALKTICRNDSNPTKNTPGAETKN